MQYNICKFIYKCQNCNYCNEQHEVTNEVTVKIHWDLLSYLGYYQAKIIRQCFFHKWIGVFNQNWHILVLKRTVKNWIVKEWRPNL